ncbi:MAG: glycosyltransferase [Cytophagales bacterium]|nr:glycosyltransferase [Cytophagales bacterium]
MEIVILITFGAIATLHILEVWQKVLAVKNYSLARNQTNPNISVVVCAHNEELNLKSLVPILLNQTYEQFEIIVVLDRCVDQSKKLMEGFSDEKISIVNIDDTDPNFHPKKMGITRGIDQAHGEWILLTDADCRPTKNWIIEMARGMSTSYELVIGLSPYLKSPSLLNQLIQYETFQTALRFVASAAAGKPYMALGRNLAYRKSSFIRNKGFGEYSRVMGGDDDLLAQSMLKKDNYKLILSDDSKVDSIPETKWSSYFHQKTRHFSVGNHYPKWIKQKEFARWAFHLLFWLLAVTSTLINPIIGVSIFIVSIVLKGLSINIVSRRLGKRFNHLCLPIVDLLYVVVLPLLSLRSLLVKNITWK